MSTVEFRCRLLETTGALPHFWEHTVGSGHAPLALGADWQEQLRRCHQELGFRHVRFHGLLSDDMGTLVDERDLLIYSFFNADQIWDFLLSIGMKPFVELSYMPTTLASGGPATCRIKGKERRFFGYLARGVPDGPDDGTIAPWAVVASLPFAPEIVLSVLRWFDELKLREAGPYGFKATFNPTYAKKSAQAPLWVSPCHLGLNQGPIVLMIENYRSGLLWRLMRQCPYLVSGLRRAGFSGGWLGSAHANIDATLRKVGKC